MVRASIAIPTSSLKSIPLCYVPFKGSSVLLNAGVKLDMMLMSAGKAEALDNGLSFSTNTCNLLIGGPKLFCPSVELGLVYSLK